METKSQFQKILEWLKQLSRSQSHLQDTVDKLAHQSDLMEKKLNMRIDGIDERFDALSDAVQALLKAMRGMRVEHYTDKTRFEKEIQKMRQEIRELMH